MAPLYGWIRQMIYAICLPGILVGSVQPARAQFIPDKGVIFHQWRDPNGQAAIPQHFYYWLNDHELVYIQLTKDNLQQYTKLDLSSGKEQALIEFTKLVQGTLNNPAWLPTIFPSPDRRYLAWVGTSKRGSETLVVSTIDGSILSRIPNKTTITHPSWSSDSQWCFGFMEGQVSPDFLPGASGKVFDAISAVNAKTPSMVKTYPIALKPESPWNGLSGYRGFDEQPPLLLDFHFGSKNNILLVSPTKGELSTDVQFAEYNLTDTTMPVLTHTVHLPPLWDFEYAVISPQGDAIVWKFNQVEDEFWVSDQYGGNLRRIGKIQRRNLPSILYPKDDYMTWLPSGNGISFLRNGELYVVYLDAH